MDDIVLPVVGHRVFGMRHDPLRFFRGNRPFPHFVVHRSRTSTIPESILSMWQRRILTDGTERSIDDIGQLLGKVNSLWQDLAGISFQLVAIVDDAIRPDHAFLMDKEAFWRYARRHNWPYLTNIYFVRDIYGASGVAKFSPTPGRLKGAVHYAVVEDQPSNPQRTTAHELGHLLSLPHEEPDENLMSPLCDYPETRLRPVQVMVSRTHAHRYLRAAAYLSDISETFREVLRAAEYELMIFRSYLGEGLGEFESPYRPRG